MQNKAPIIKTFNLRNILNIAFPFIGIYVIIFDLLNTCKESCSLSGSIIGIDLRYIGIVFMSLILAVRFLKHNYLYVPLAMGLGAELYLTGFQILNHTYCPYCLAFAATVLSLSMINIKASKAVLFLLFAVFGFIFFLIAPNCAITPGLQYCPASY